MHTVRLLLSAQPVWISCAARLTLLSFAQAYTGDGIVNSPAQSRARCSRPVRTDCRHAVTWSRLSSRATRA
jgi:hypothetical protein